MFDLEHYRSHEWDNEPSTGFQGGSTGAAGMDPDGVIEVNSVSLTVVYPHVLLRPLRSPFRSRGGFLKLLDVARDFSPNRTELLPLPAVKLRQGRGELR